MTEPGGQFQVTCAADGAGGVTQISGQFVRAPFHLSKPYWTGDVLVIQAVNATAGVFAGDRLSMEVRLEQGARVLLTSPSAHRIHTMASGWAEFTQAFHVAPQAWLEVMPELFIPQRGCRYRQRSRVDVDPEGGLYFVETLAPGRVAHGEAFAFDRLDWETEVWRGDELLVRERYHLAPGDDSLWPLRVLFPETYYATCYFVHPGGLESGPLLERVEALNDDQCRVGATMPAPRCWSIRILAADSGKLRSALAGVRAILSAIEPGLSADTRKL